ncbi:MAG: 50S ribosomal protein L10 [Candidatus Aminicenantaceae bacterium]
MKREGKEQVVKSLGEIFNRINTFYLVDFKGMNVSQSVELRKLMQENSFSFQVIKNRLALRALKEEFPESLRECFQGPTAIAFTSQDALGLARTIKDFSSKNNVLSVKGGILEGQFLASEKFDQIARLTSKKELLGKIGYLIAYPLIELIRTWQAPLLGLGRMLSQFKTKK